MSELQFPILDQGSSRRLLRYPKSIPWAMLEPHEAQARRNHGQTLERLAERGGLGVSEVLWVLTDRKIDFSEVAETQAKVDELNNLVVSWMVGCERALQDRT